MICWLLLSTLMSVDDAALTFGFIPARLSGDIGSPGLVPAFLTPLTATIAHGGALHLLINMIMLVWCGTWVERGLGARALVILYVFGAYAAALAQWSVDPSSVVPMIGASGAVSAIVGAFALSYGQPKRIVRSPGLNRALNALWLLVAWVALQLMTGWAAGTQGVLLATPAHVGGFLLGLVLQRPLLLWRYRGA
ncbi:MAG TPA: rhomboid family intramembrane serine protease [Sphingomicrobium sp.]|nr:rhomboid family intramembrane serine protease [Sphingomicrobium sp.]